MYGKLRSALLGLLPIEFDFVVGDCRRCRRQLHAEQSVMFFHIMHAQKEIVINGTCNKHFGWRDEIHYSKDNLVPSLESCAIKVAEHETTLSSGYSYVFNVARIKVDCTCLMVLLDIPTFEKSILVAL